MSEMTPDRLRELRRIAEAAPRGPWWECRDEKPAPEWGPEQEVYDADGRLVCEIATEGDLDRDLAVKDHISTFDPPTVLAMLDRIEALEYMLLRLYQDTVVPDTGYCHRCGCQVFHDETCAMAEVEELLGIEAGEGIDDE